MEGDARSHAGAAVGDELAVGQIWQWLVPGGVGRAGDPPRRIVDLVRLAAPTVRGAGVDERERRIGEAARDLVSRDGVAAPLVQG